MLTKINRNPFLSAVDKAEVHEFYLRSLEGLLELPAYWLNIAVKL